MRRYLAAITILLVAALALSMFAGCSKKPKTTGSSVTSPSAPSAPGSTGPGEVTKGTPSPTVRSSGSGPISELLAKQRAVTSYVQTIQFNGKSIKNKVKLKDGKPVCAKMDMGKDGMMLIRYDKKAQYIIDTKNNAAMMLPVTNQTAGVSNQSSIAGLDDPARLKNLKVSVERMGGKECWKVSKAKSDLVFWAGKDNGLPVQVKLGDKTMKFSYEKINAVPDSEFELPAGCRIQTMPSRGNLPAPPPGH